jgi:hypothetical protein
MPEFKSRISHPLRLLFVLPFFILVAIIFITCGKRTAPAPPIPNVPVPPPFSKVFQQGDQFLYILQLPTQNTNPKTPLEISKIEVYRLKDPRVQPTQTQPQTQPQTQTVPAQTQPKLTQSQPAVESPLPGLATQSFPTQTQISQTQTGQTQTAQSQTAQSQTRSQTQAQSQTQTQPGHEEMPHTVPAEDFKSHAEKIAEIPKDMVDAYIRDNYFVFTDKINPAPDSDDSKNWFHYEVKIYNKKGKTGGFSPDAALFPAVVPQAPKGFTGTVGEKRISLTWSPVAQDTAGKPLDSSAVAYNIYRGTSANFAPIQPVNPSPLTTTTFDDTTFEYGQSYYYFVRARLLANTKAQESGPSNAILFFPQDTFPPTAPQELNAVAAREGMVLIWAPNPEEDIAGYNVYRSTESGTGYKKINTDLVRETTYSDKDVQMQQKYYYVVTAVDNAPVPNESPYSTETSEIKRHQ